MRVFADFSTRSAWITALLLGLLTAGCGGEDPILGAGVATFAPTVTAVTPVANAVAVPLSTTITATFNQPMAPITSASTFTVTCAAPCVSPTGAVSLSAGSTIASFTLTPKTALTPDTVYTATITGATGLANGIALAQPKMWTFTTASTLIAPTVTAVAPVNGATGVGLNTTITAAFSAQMAAITGAASFTVTCVAPCTNPAGTVSLDAASTTATFAPTANLEPLQTYTATITGATALATGLAMASPYSWSFETGATTNTTRPVVLSTVPVTTIPGPTAGVPVNSAVSATFSEPMAVATINGTSFTVTCTAPCASPAGTVSYDVGSHTAVFTPTAPLTVASTYTATITTAVTDLSGNALGGNQPPPAPAASDYVWTFTTVAAAAAPVHVTVKSTNPTAGQTGVCPNGSVNATFSVGPGLRMDPSTVNAATFTVTGPFPALTAVTAASVVLDAATGTIATFTPQTALTPGGTYTATIFGGADGVKDLAVPADDMTNNVTWSFTAGPATGTCLVPVPLGTASTYGDFGGTAGMTNTGVFTVINGNIGTTNVGTSSVTGFNDTAGDVYTETPANIGTVNGTIYTCTTSTTGPNSVTPSVANCNIAKQALADATTAYGDLKNLPGGPDPGGNLAGLTLAPGVYTSAAGTFEIVGGNLTLDAGGNPNAVWVFQMAATLTVGGPGATAPESVILAGGAQAKNVYWQVGSAATINAAGGGTMVGTIISQTGAVFSTAGNVVVLTLNGRVLSLGASITLVNTVINVPPQ